MAELSPLQAASQGLANTNINLLVRNNRNYIQGVSLMGQGGGTSINANIEFRYDFTNFVFNESFPYTVIIQYKGRDSEGGYSTLQTQVNGFSLAAVTSALNSFLISQFNTFTEDGKTYISTYNNRTEFNNLYLVSALPDNIVDYMITESGDFIVTQDGDFLVTQDVSTNLFPVEIFIYPTDDPAVLVFIQEGGKGGVTYAQVTSSYGLNNYEVDGLYLYSPDIKQLNKPISYASIDATGNAQVIAIPNVVDPNQVIPSSLVDLSQFEGSILLDGLSVINTDILPQNQLQMKFLAKAVTARGELSDNFLDIQEATNTKFFEPPSGDISEFEKNDALIVESANIDVSYDTEDDLKRTQYVDNSSNTFAPKKTIKPKKQGKVKFPELKQNSFLIAVIGIAAIAGFLLLNKKNKD
jgi:hypothetical protein